MSQIMQMEGMVVVSVCLPKKVEGSRRDEVIVDVEEVSTQLSHARQVQRCKNWRARKYTCEKGEGREGV